MNVGGLTLGGKITARTTFTNTGTIDVGSGWVHLGVSNTTPTIFNMNAGTLDAHKLNVANASEADLRVKNGVIKVSAITDLSANFTLDFSSGGTGTLTVNGDMTSNFEDWIDDGFITLDNVATYDIDDFDISYNSSVTMIGLSSIPESKHFSSLLMFCVVVMCCLRRSFVA
jgi:hypothetical protein